MFSKEKHRSFITSITKNCMDEAYEHPQLQELVWHQITPIADDLVDSFPLRIHSQLKTNVAEIASAQTSPFLGGGKGQI